MKDYVYFGGFRIYKVFNNFIKAGNLLTLKVFACEYKFKEIAKEKCVICHFCICNLDPGSVTFAVFDINLETAFL